MKVALDKNKKKMNNNKKTSSDMESVSDPKIQSELQTRCRITILSQKYAKFYHTIGI